MLKRLIVLIVLLMSATAVFAQEATGGNLCYGWFSLDPNNDRVVEGTITDADPVHQWVFPGRASTYVTIRLEVTDGDLDPFVYIDDNTTNQRILTAAAEERTPDGRSVINIRNLPLSSTGNYKVTVSRLGESQGRTSGTYRLSLEPGIANGIAGTSQDTLIFDNEVISKKATANQADAWYFEGVRGQLVTIIAHNISEDAAMGTKQFILVTPSISFLPVHSEPRIDSDEIARITKSSIFELLDEQNTYFKIKLLDGTEGWVGSYFVARIDSDLDEIGLTLKLFQYDGQTWQAITSAAPSLTEERLANFPLPGDGHYAIVIQSSLTDLTYQVTLAGAGGERPPDLPCVELPPECPAISPLGGAGVPLANEVPASGNITAATPAIAYQFIALEGNAVSITMQRSGGDLDTFLALADADGNILQREDGFDPATATIADFRIPTDGCYYALASRNGVGDGSTEGPFILTVSGIPETANDVKPFPPEGIPLVQDLVPGEPVSESLDDSRWRVAYRFRSGPGGSFTAVATRLGENTLSPALVLLDAEGNERDAVTANFVGDASNPLRVEADAGAYYFIVVQREGGATSTGVGDFQLTITAS